MNSIYVKGQCKPNFLCILFLITSPQKLVSGNYVMMTHYSSLKPKTQRSAKSLKCQVNKLTAAQLALKKHTIK